VDLDAGGIQRRRDVRHGDGLDGARFRRWAFAVGLVLAARMLPGLLLGLAAGTLADRIQRNRLLATVSLAAVPLMLVFSWLAGRGTIEVWQLVGLSFKNGSVPVFDVPARQALVMDTVPREVAPNAMALNALAAGPERYVRNEPVDDG
jgi:MFS family permease